MFNDAQTNNITLREIPITTSSTIKVQASLKEGPVLIDQVPKCTIQQDSWKDFSVEYLNSDVQEFDNTTMFIGTLAKKKKVIFEIL